jgi:hypothetical protein
MNKNDAIRNEILKCLYNHAKQAQAIIRTKLNERGIIVAMRGTDYTTPDIISNLLYLVQAGWIKQEKIEKIPYYSINDKGINYFEGTSEFQRSHWITGINISNTQGVVVVGDHNFVQQEFNHLYRELDLLKSELGKSSIISDQDKLNYQSEIETIQSQLAKQTPNKSIINEAWLALGSLATIDGVVSLYQRLQPLINHLIH